MSALLDWLPHIRSLGCDVLYLGPVFEADFHGYDTADYLMVDWRLGTNETLKEFSRALHDAGIKLVLDTVFNHVGRNFFAFKDLQANDEASIYKDWFCGLDFSRQSSYGDRFYYEGWYDAYNLVKLNLKNPEVKNYLFSVVAFWIDEFGVDGLRLDVAEIMDKQLLSDLAAYCRHKEPAIWLLGEMITGDYNDLVNPGMLDSTTNYELYKSLYSSHNDHNLFELAHTLERQAGSHGIYSGLPLYTFLDNHDTTRIASLLPERGHLFTAYALLFMLPGIPSLYYGSEWAIPGVKGAHEDTALRPQVKTIPDLMDCALFAWIRRLSALRLQSPAIRYGAYRQLYITHQQFIFCRVYREEIWLLAVNIAAQATAILIDADALPFRLTDQLDTAHTIGASNGKLTMEIPGYGVRIFCGTIG